jgi:DNA polymerase
MNPAHYKQQLLDELYRPYVKCIECPLGTLGRTHVVFGSGNPDARLMFIGEGPGQDEDIQGKPFVGRSGKLLNTIFATLGLERSHVYISNIVKCRPPQNRKPTSFEMKTCKDLLLTKQINIIRPKVICTLGSSALEGLLERPVKIGQLRGTKLVVNGIEVVPTYHPAYVLRNPAGLPELTRDIKRAFELIQNNSQ